MLALMSVPALCGVGLVVCGSAEPAGEDGLSGVEGEISAGEIGGLELDREALLGSLWGLRDGLEYSGLTLGGEYVAEYSGVLSGGVAERGSFRNVLTVDAELDLEMAGGWEGATVFAQYLMVNGESGGSLDSGDIQVYSNLESDIHLSSLYELWFEQRLFDDRLRLKFGKLDANSEFAFVEVAGDFSHSSAGFSPTVLGFPSYPDSATGLVVSGRVWEGSDARLTFGYGLFDGALGVDGVRTGGRGPATFFSDDVSDDWFQIGEGVLEWGLAAESEGSSWFGGGRVTGGLWHHSGDFERFDGDGSESGTIGVYGTAELRVFELGEGAIDHDRGVWVFGQYGWADEELSEVGQHVAVGAVGRGMLFGRDGDSCGVYASWVDLSDEDGAGFDDDEFALDGYYRVRLTPWVYVQPELQYIVNPSGDPSIDDAFVGGVRVGVTF